MARKSNSNKQEFEYRAEMKQLLHLIIHSLYTHPEIFLRELISNASDALNKIRFRMLTDEEVLDKDAELKINIKVDEKNHTFTIEDTGIGMTKDELVNNIGTIAKSDTLEFLKKIKEEGKNVSGDLIGQFGVGFYSVFMVTDEVVIEIRAADPDSKGYRWVSNGEGTFSIEEIDKKNRGTKISFTFKKEAEEFADSYRIRNIIQKYSNFVDFPIYLGEEKVNQVVALWHKSKDDIKEEELTEFYKFISNDFEAPLGHLHLSLEGVVNFKALLFIPAKAPLNLFRDPSEKNIHLYSSKVFIQDDNKDLLPDYLGFVKGVVDTEDLPLNVSREVTQNSPLMQKMRNIITGKLLGYLEDMAKKEPEKYKKFYENFGPVFKMGVNTDFTNKDRIVELLRFESTMTDKGEYTSLKSYVSRMDSEQKEIYYLSGEHREILEQSPKLEYFKKNNIEVLLLTDPMDIFILPTIGEYDKKSFKSIDKADLDLKDRESDDKEEPLNENLAKSLIDIFKETLGDKVEDVIESKRLVDSAATLVSPKDAMDAQMERMMKLLNKDFTASGKKLLEINLNHPLIKNMGKMIIADDKNPLLRQIINQIYDGALLIDGNLESPIDMVKRMTEIMEKATAK